MEEIKIDNHNQKAQSLLAVTCNNIAIYYKRYKGEHSGQGSQKQPWLTWKKLYKFKPSYSMIG